MSLIPAFKIGLWNAWIFSVINLLLDFPYYVIRGGKEARKKFFTLPEYGKLINIKLIAPILYVYSIFLPIKLGTALFYVGFPIYILAVVWSVATHVSFAITPLDEPVTKGTYRISRNPAFLGQFLIFVGMGITCASWIFILCAIVYIIIANQGLVFEERWCLEKYGDAYREYMNRTPRWIGIPKSRKRSD